MNIAPILRTMADYFSKERKLFNLMTKQLGFSLEERVFKKSARVDQKSKTTVVIDGE